MEYTQSKSLIGRRLIAFTIDFLLLFVVTFLFFGLVSDIIASATTDIDAIVVSYQAHASEYASLKQDASAQASELAKLETTIGGEQNYILLVFLYRIIISLLPGTFVFFWIIPLCLQRGRTLGKLIMKIAIAGDDNSALPWQKVLLRNVLSSLTNIYLNLVTFGLLGIINLIIALFRQDNRAPYELLTKSKTTEDIIPVSLNADYQD